MTSLHLNDATRALAQRDFREALRLARDVRSRHGSTKECSLIIAESLLGLSRYEEVRAELSDLLAHEPREQRALRLFGESLLLSGRSTEARTLLERAHSLNPNDEHVARLLSQLGGDDVDFDDASTKEVFAWTEEQTMNEFRGGDASKQGAAGRVPPLGGASLPPPAAVFRPPTRAPASRPPPAAAPPPRASTLPKAPTSPATAPPPPMRNPGSVPPPLRGSAPIPRPAAPVAPQPLGKLARSVPQQASDAVQLQSDAFDLEDFTQTSGDFDDLDEEDTKARHKADNEAIPAPLDDVPTRAKSTSRPEFPPPRGAKPAPPAELEGDPTRAKASRPAAPLPGAGVVDSTPLLSDPTRAKPSTVSAPPLRSFPANPSPFNSPPPPLARPEYAPTLPPPPQRRSKHTWLAYAGLPALAFAAAFAGYRVYRSSQSEAQIETATLAATSSGLERSVRQALEADAAENAGGSEAIARRAWLRSVSLLEHGYDEADRVRSTLALLSDAGRAQPRAVAAQIYLDIATGQYEHAEALAQVQRPDDPELLFARAQLAYATSSEPPASFADVPGTRAGSLRLRLAANHVPLPELSDVPGVAELRSTPAGRIALAHYHLRRAEPAIASEHAEVVLAELESASSPKQRTEAALLLARAKLALGDRAAAEAALRTATETRVITDEGVSQLLVRTFLDLGDVAGARARLDALPTSPPPPPSRQQLTAEVLLAALDYPALADLLDSLPPGPSTDYLNGRVLESQGQMADALLRYQAARVAPTERLRASLAAAKILADERRSNEVIALLEPLTSDPTAMPSIVLLLTRSLISENRQQEAQRWIATALQRAPTDFDVLLASAEGDLADGDPAAAKATLQQLTIRAAGRADAQALLGRSCRLLGEFPEANTAYERALAQEPRNAEALVGRTELAFLTLDHEAATVAVATARTAGVLTEEQSTLLQARVAVLEGGGQIAVRLLERLARDSRDAILLTTYGAALAQAERMGDAERALSRALALDATRPDALLAAAQVHVRESKLADAARVLGDAERAIESQRLGPVYRAQMLAIRARLLFESNELDEARARAEEAVRLDPRCSAAHFVLFLHAEARGNDSLASLRQAGRGRLPSPEVFARLFDVDSRSANRCDYARKYLVAAPRGDEARSIRRKARRCR